MSNSADFPKSYRSMALIATLLTLVGVLFLSWFIYIYISPADGIQRGEIVIQALKNYHNDNKKYPEVLQQLVPNYLPTFPQHSGGQGYQYQPCPDGQGYALSFNRSFLIFYNRWWGYSPAIPEWRCFDGGPPPYFYDMPCGGHVPSFTGACK